MSIRITNKIKSDPRTETILEKANRWRINASLSEGMSKQAKSPSELAALQSEATVYRNLAKELEEADVKFLLCPRAELKGKYSVVLFFENESESRELIDMVKAAKPNMVEHPL